MSDLTPSARARHYRQARRYRRKIRLQAHLVVFGGACALAIILDVIAMIVGH